MSCNDYCNLQPHIECVGEWEIGGLYPDCECEFVCTQAEVVEPEPEVEVEPEPVEVEAPAEWCEPTDIDIFTEPYIPIEDLSIFLNPDYDMEFGPNQIEHVLKNDKVTGYVEFNLPENLRYTNLVISSRLINEEKIVEGETILEEDLSRYGDYNYHYWEGFTADNLGDLSIEVKIVYDIADATNTQCQIHTIPVKELESTDFSDSIEFENIEYSRGRIFYLIGNFTETLYDELSRDFAATFRTEHISDSTIFANAKFNHVNKVVCNDHSCAFKSEVNLPRASIQNFTTHDQWCTEDFELSIRFDRGTGQYFTAEVPTSITGQMCNKLNTGAQ